MTIASDNNIRQARTSTGLIYDSAMQVFLRTHPMDKERQEFSKPAPRPSHVQFPSEGKVGLLALDDFRINLLDLV